MRPAADITSAISDLHRGIVGDIGDQHGDAMCRGGHGLAAGAEDPIPGRGQGKGARAPDARGCSSDQGNGMG